MNASLATLVYACGIAGLFFLNRDKSVRTSKALWIPVVYLWSIGSRAPSVWLGIAPPAGTDVQLDGTPFDRVFFMLILAAAFVVLFQRGSRAAAVLKANWPALAFFGFCLVSCLWSDYPDVSAKRWIKAVGDLAMVVIIVSDVNPIAAFKRVISRVGFLLIPASVLLIKYFPLLGRMYDRWIGTQMMTGVTTNKNLLGVIVMVLSLGTLWQVIDLYRTKDAPNRRRRLVAQSTLLLMGIYLLLITDSATSRACFEIGAMLVIASNLSSIRRRPVFLHAMVVLFVAATALPVLLGNTETMAHAVGRNGTLTGRTEIWAAVIPFAPNPLVGAGFESFWLGDRVQKIWNIFPGNPLNEAHDGYIEVYLNLGLVGLSLLVFLLVTGYRRASAAFRRAPGFAGLIIAYMAVSFIYNITEAGFRMVSPMWFFLLLAIVSASVAVRANEFATNDARRFAPVNSVTLRPERQSLTFPRGQHSKSFKPQRGFSLSRQEEVIQIKGHSGR